MRFQNEQFINSLMNELSMDSDNEKAQRKPQKPEKPEKPVAQRAWKPKVLQARVLIMKISPGAQSSTRTVPTLRVTRGPDSIQ